MNFHHLRIPALLLLVIPLCAHGQSLGDVARQTRAEQQQNGAPRLKVYTNDDIASPAGTASENSSQNNGAESAEAKNSAGSKTAGKGSTSPEKQRELETEKRTEEINRQYLDRIKDIRAKIVDAQKDLARLQRDQVESTNEFRNTVGASPSIPQYQEQQKLFDAQIDEQRNAIANLNSQLEDAQESARHAGVPNAGD